MVDPKIIQRRVRIKASLKYVFNILNIVLFNRTVFTNTLVIINFNQFSRTGINAYIILIQVYESYELSHDVIPFVNVSRLCANIAF